MPHDGDSGKGQPQCIRTLEEECIRTVARGGEQACLETVQHGILEHKQADTGALTEGSPVLDVRS